MATIPVFFKVILRYKSTVSTMDTVVQKCSKSRAALHPKFNLCFNLIQGSVNMYLSESTSFCLL